MNYLIIGLILFFIFLIWYQIFLAYFTTIREGNQNYQSYDKNSMILAEKNAGNIEVLRGQLNKIEPILPIITDLSGNVTQLQQQVNQLVQAHANYGKSIAGSKPANVTGTS
jgi:hypothetical protein